MLSKLANSKQTFVVPAVVIVILLGTFPFIHAIVLSFTDISSFRQTQWCISLQNWTQLISDQRFWSAVQNTLFFIVGGLALQYPLGLLLALIITSRLPGYRLTRAGFLLPMFISPIATGYIVGRMLFHPTMGAANDLLARIGFPSVPWLTSAWPARVVLVLVDSWQWIPFFMIFLLAKLESIPAEQFEAARVDGANAWQVFRYIKFPQLVATSVALVIARSLLILRTIEIPFIVTGGGPGAATESVTMYAYNFGVRGGNIAYGATASLVVIMIGLMIISIVGALRLGIARVIARGPDEKG